MRSRAAVLPSGGLHTSLEGPSRLTPLCPSISQTEHKPEAWGVSVSLATLVGHCFLDRGLQVATPRPACVCGISESGRPRSPGLTGEGILKAWEGECVCCQQNQAFFQRRCQM